MALQVMWKSPLLVPLALLGLPVVARSAYAIANFFYMHLLYRSKLPQYRRPGAYALVTGSSAGIGLELADQLASYGFNVVLHGRNAAKLEGVVQKLRKQHKSVDIRYVVADAAKGETQASMPATIQRIADEMRQLPGPLTVLINNMGGLQGIYGPETPLVALPDLSPAALDATVDTNVRFALHLTRTLLPVMAPDSEGDPAPFLVLNMSSFAGDFAMPYLGIYGGSKAFIQLWTTSLQDEMSTQPRYSNGKIMCMHIGEVTGASGIDKAVSFGLPSADTLARSVLDKAGYGQTDVTPYWAHDVQISVTKLLPEGIRRAFVKQAIQGQRVWYDERERRLAKKA